MPKGGSGFARDAARQAGALLGRGSSANNVRWRIGSGGNVAEYQKEMTDIFKSMYRQSTIERDERGNVVRFKISRAVYDSIGARTYNLASKIANHIEIFDPEAQSQYNQLREQAKGIKLSSAERREIRDTLRGQQRMFVSGSGRSDAGSRAEESGYRTDEWNNVSIARRLNENINAARDSIWHSVHKEGADAARGYTQTVMQSIFERYKKTERAASQRRKK